MVDVVPLLRIISTVAVVDVAWRSPALVVVMMMGMGIGMLFMLLLSGEIGKRRRATVLVVVVNVGRISIMAST